MVLFEGGSMESNSSQGGGDATKQSDQQSNSQVQQTPNQMGMPPFMPGMAMPGFPGAFPPMMGMRPPGMQGMPSILFSIFLMRPAGLCQIFEAC